MERRRHWFMVATILVGSALVICGMSSERLSAPALLVVGTFMLSWVFVETDGAYRD